MAKQEPIIGKAVEKLKLASLDPQARMDYEAREKALKDMASLREDGLQEGMEKGQVIKGKEVAKKMIERGMDPAVIVELTGLPELEIIKLKQELNK